MKNKLAVIIVYFGKFPKYMQYFLKSASYSSRVDFLIFTDADFDNYSKYDNIIFYKFLLNDFNRLANERINLGFDFLLKNSYKLCDLKPMYGWIFQNYLVNYEAWAHSDIDIFIGDFIDEFEPILLGEVDVISSHARYISGAFTAYRNKDYVNTLFMRSKDCQRVLCDDKILYFDEASNVISKLWSGYNIFDFESEIESMTHLVKNKKHNINALFLNLIVEKLDGKLFFDAGSMHDKRGKVKIFHFLIYKNKLLFNVPRYCDESNWSFSEYGIFTSFIYSRTVSLVKSFCSNISIKISNKISKFI